MNNHHLRDDIFGTWIPSTLSKCKLWRMSSTPLLHPRVYWLVPFVTERDDLQLSNLQNPDITLHYTDWFIGILILVEYNPLYTANNHGFGHCSVEHVQKLYTKTPSQVLHATGPYHPGMVALNGGAAEFTSLPHAVVNVWNTQRVQSCGWWTPSDTDLPSRSSRISTPPELGPSD